MNEPTAQYRSRFRRILEYIEAHLQEDLSVEALSGVAAFSKCHFHRQFSASFGIGVYKYVQLLRLKRASYQLAFREQPVIEVALSSGYEGPEAFARAFRRTFGQSPTEFRRQPEWEPWFETYALCNELRLTHMKPSYAAHQVSIVDFRETRVAILEHRGDPRSIGDSIRKFIAWRKRNRLPPSASATFNIAYDDPAQTDPQEFRCGLCATTDSEIADNEEGVVAGFIPAGRCAVLRHTGSDDTLAEAITYLYSQWLPSSGAELRDFPLYFQRVRFFPEVPEHQAQTDIFLPLK